MDFDHVNQKIEDPAGGPIELSGVVVPANSGGNVSRWVMATSVSADIDYWTKIAEINLGTTQYGGRNIKLIFSDLYIAGLGGKMEANIRLYQDTIIQVGNCKVQVESLNGNMFTHDCLKLTADSTVIGSTLSLWLQKKAIYGKISVREVVNDSRYSAGVLTTYFNDAAWQSATPTGSAVNITSDYAGSAGVVESGSNSNGYYVKYADGTMICSVNKTISISVTTASGAIYVDFGIAAQTWPATFTAINGGSCQWHGSSNAWGDLGGLSTTTYTPMAYSAVNTVVGSVSATIIGIGKWK